MADNTTQYWYDQLITHPLVKDGMRDDDHLRATAISKLELPSIFNDFDAVRNEVHSNITQGDVINPNQTAPPVQRTDEIQRVIDGFPPGMGTMLYNTGVTNFITDRESEKILDKPDDPSFNEAGLYDNSCKCAITETGHSDTHAIIRHEAGHALSSALGSDIEGTLEPHAKALEQDLRALKPEQWEQLKALDNEHLSFIALDIENVGRMALIRIKEDYEREFDHENPAGLRGKSRHAVTYNTIKALQELGNEEVNTLFPNLEESLGSNGLQTDLNMHGPLSHHQRLIAAYEKDLNALLEGNGPNGTSLIQENGVPYIIDANDDKTMAIPHYAPDELGGDQSNHYEEAFAEITDNITAPLFQQGREKDLATYFPSMAKEITGIMGALDMAHGNAPSSEVEPETPTVPIPPQRPTGFGAKL